MAMRGPIAAILISTVFMAAGVATAAGPALDDTQKQGRRLYEQSCGVCHTKPTALAPLYGPALHMQSLSGDAEALLIVISDGTPRMPGFKHTYDPAQIKSIIAYLKTMPVPPPETNAPPTPRPTRDVD